jgi:hypothetical protein
MRVVRHRWYSADGGFFGFGALVSFPESGAAAVATSPNRQIPLLRRCSAVLGEVLHVPGNVPGAAKSTSDPSQEGAMAKACAPHWHHSFQADWARPARTVVRKFRPRYRS